MLPKMWKILIIFVGFLFRSNAQGTDGDCFLEEVSTNQWLTAFKNEPVNDYEEELFKEFKAENIKSVKVIGIDYGKYFDAALEDGNLKVFPTTDFRNYEVEQESVSRPEMSIELAFECSNNKPKSLTFEQPIIDHNTYSPEFSSSSYTYQLPMPLPASFDIAPFGNGIEACDDDISNTRLDFSISPDDDFSISWGNVISGRKNKCHTAIIKTKNPLRLTTNKNYEITVTDMGDPSKQTAAELKIIIDELTTLPPNPHFESAYYTATYNSKDDEHSITDTDIKLKDGCSKPKLSLIGAYIDYFHVDCVADKVVVKLIENLPEDALENNPIVLITIEADLANAEERGRTVLVVYLPPQECPEFTTVIPTACPSTVTPTECPICPTETTSSYTCPPCNTECPSTPTECPPCSTTPAVECTTLSSTECPPCSTTPGECPSTQTECPLTCPSFSTTPGDSSSVSTVTCPPPELTTECPPSPTTPGECPSVSTECPLTCPPCSTTPNECPTPSDCPITCPPVSTAPTDCPSVSTECPVTCPAPELTTECPPCPTTSSEWSSPSTECPVTCPTTEQTTECPPCSTTAAPPPDETVIKFEQDNYWYKFKSWYVGSVIGVVKAVATPKEDIEYSIESEDNDFMECNEKTGELKLTKEVEAGIYNFIAYAVGVESKTKTQTIVVAEIINDQENAGPDSKYSILVEHVVEEQETNIVLPCQGYTYCKYTEGGQFPETEDDIFKLENNILHVSAIKRERKDIINMLVPQFTLRFFLTDVGPPIEDKHKQSNNSLRMPSKTDLNTELNPTKWVYIPANVSNIPYQLLMSIIIDDINNNYPVFEIGSELVVGYPTAELAVQITPPYLTKVLATDLDAVENAIIRYSTESTHFIVHPETGVIYPGEDAFDDQLNLKFTVTATDRNGAEDGLQTHLKIEVKPLKKENLIVLMVKNLMLEDIDDAMQKLSEKTNMKINYLTAAVIPLSNSKDSLFEQTDNTVPQLRGFLRSMIMPKANADHYSRVIVYGLDTTNEPVETDVLQEVLEDAGVLEDFTVDKWEPGCSSEGGNNGDGDGDCDGDGDPSTAGFIAAIAVLASLLVIFLLAAAAFYYFKIYKAKKPEPYDNMEEEDTNSVNFEKNPRLSSVSKYEDAPQRRVTGFVFNPPPIEEDEDEFGEKPYENVTDYGVKDDWTKNDTVDLGENEVRFVDTAEDDLYGETKVKLEDNPKSVTFKETVQKINIVVDDPQDDDTLDERL